MFGRLTAIFAALALVTACTWVPTPTASPSPAPSVAPIATAQPSVMPAPTSPTPGATATSTHVATPSTPPLDLAVSGDDIGRHLDSLMHIATDNAGIRAAGTPGYAESADYVAAELQRLGFNVSRDPFDFTFFNEAEPVALTVGDQQWTGAAWLHSMLYGGAGDVAGVLESVMLTPDGRLIGTGGCDPADWAGFVAGHIAVIESGPCLRLDQVLNAQNAGAIGLISLYPHWLANQTRRPTLIDPGAVTIPAIVAGGEPTAAILAALAAGGSTQIHVAVDTHAATIDNVIGEIPGASDEVVMLGGHLDSVLDGPGINDNGSGVATLLSLARSVSEQRQPPTRAIRIAFWGAEEFGEFGSAAYVAGLDAAQRSRIHAYLNLDMVASPNAGRFVYDEPDAPAGSDELGDALLAALSAAGTPGAPITLGGASDHFSFQQAGIPIGGVFSGLNPLTAEQAALFGALPTEPADPCYHLSCDTRANINLDSAVALGSAMAKVVQDLAFLP